MVIIGEAGDAGALALTFASTFETARGHGIDLLASADDVRSWLRKSGLPAAPHLGEAMQSPAFLRTVFVESHRLRAALRALFTAHAEGTIPEADAMHALNRVLERGARVVTLEAVDGRLALSETERDSGPLAVLAPIARSGARLVTRVDGRRLRECAATGCRRWFVDTSKAGRRRWCSMTRCGNREKAARHRRRHSAPA